jgi:hypothetical protein
LNYVETIRPYFVSLIRFSPDCCAQRRRFLYGSCKSEYQQTRQTTGRVKAARQVKLQKGLKKPVWGNRDR